MNMIYTGKSKIIRRICEILNQCVQRFYVNGVEQVKTNGTVEISVPNATSQLENDSGFVTGDVINGKVDKVDGKGLSANDLTDALLDKLNGIAEGANKVSIDSALSAASTNPVQNQVVKAALDGKAASSHKHNKTDITDFPVSLKNPNALTIQFNGTTNKTYDGSSAVTVNITPSVIGAASASAVADSGWKAAPLGSFASSGTIQYRVIGKMITICGTSVKLQSEVLTSANAPRALANCNYDFSSIKECRGLAKFGTYTAEIRAEQYSGDNLISILGVGQTIPSGTTGNFTITGLID